MTKIKFLHRAGEFERFAPGAFDSQIWTSINVNMPSGTRDGVLLAAEVSEDGRSVEMTIEIGEGT